MKYSNSHLTHKWSVYGEESDNKIIHEALSSHFPIIIIIIR